MAAMHQQFKYEENTFFDFVIAFNCSGAKVSGYASVWVSDAEG